MPPDQTDQLRAAAALVATRARWAGPDHPDTEEARLVLRSQRLERHLRQELSTWPPLTERFRDSMATLLLATPVQPDDDNHGGRQ